MFSTKLAIGVVAAATLFAAVPASAVITTFADYKSTGSAANVYWKNDGSNASNGTGGSLYTISSGGATAPGTTKINFSFLQPALASISGITADFTLLASVTNTPALTPGGFKIQSSIAGGFTILSTSVITVGNTVFNAGSNLLSGTFGGGNVFGQTGGTSGSFSAATSAGSTITYTSDFLSFLPAVEYDFSLSLTSISSALASNNGKALRSFKATSTGSFSSDPAPIPVVGVPESATWAMFICGFGLIGATLRRRRAQYSLGQPLSV